MADINWIVKWGQSVIGPPRLNESWQEYQKRALSEYQRRHPGSQDTEIDLPFLPPERIGESTPEMMRRVESGEARDRMRPEPPTPAGLSGELPSWFNMDEARNAYDMSFDPELTPGPLNDPSIGEGYPFDLRPFSPLDQFREAYQPDATLPSWFNMEDAQKAYDAKPETEDKKPVAPAAKPVTPQSKPVAKANGPRQELRIEDQVFGSGMQGLPADKDQFKTMYQGLTGAQEKEVRWIDKPGVFEGLMTFFLGMMGNDGDPWGRVGKAGLAGINTFTKIRENEADKDAEALKSQIAMQKSLNEEERAALRFEMDRQKHPYALIKEQAEAEKKMAELERKRRMDLMFNPDPKENEKAAQDLAGLQRLRYSMEIGSETQKWISYQALEIYRQAGGKKSVDEALQEAFTLYGSKGSGSAMWEQLDPNRPENVDKQGMEAFTGTPFLQ